MLKRTVTGVVAAAVAAAALFANGKFPLVTIIFVAALAALGVFEILYNTKIIKHLRIAVAAAVFAFFQLIAINVFVLYSQFFAFIYVAAVAVTALVYYKEFSLTALASCLAFPLIIPWGFTCIYTVFANFGVAYLLLLLNFSCICDIGAYFIGSIFGKHKLCPEISPKKTVEGAVGGIVCSLIASAVICICFGFTVSQIISVLAITPVLCIVGMVGDLFASLIKRSVGIKDYGNLLPGHGGILDRFDSILLISPVFLTLLEVLL